MDRVIDNLECVLKKKYNFCGTLKDIRFKGNSVEDAFQLLIDRLEASVVKTEVEDVAQSLVTISKPRDNVANIGDIALVYWLGTGWFTAKIEGWDPLDLSFLVRWTEGNWRPEKAKYSNVCIDKVPNEDFICVGIKVLFKQGLFYCGFNDDGTGRTLNQDQKNELRRKNQISDRWHVGVVTDIKISAITGEEKKFYSGHHVEQGDPQCTRGNYVDYSPTFTGLMIEELRVFTDVSLMKNVSLESKQIDSKPFNSDSSSKSLVTISKPRDNVANVGDIALVYWLGTGWFTARIEGWDQLDFSFLVRWTDGNWRPEKAKYSNVCIDKVPNQEYIEIGTKVLFKQGLFYCGFKDDGTGRSLNQEQKDELKRKNQISDRWHVGVITYIETTTITGKERKFFSGRHIEPNDPQCTRGNYVGYSPTFERLSVEMLRVFADMSGAAKTNASAVYKNAIENDDEAS